MSKVIFDYKGEYTTVSCKENEKMEEICKRFTNKDLNDLHFIYSGKIINMQLRYNEIINNIDKERKIMLILVTDKNDAGVLNTKKESYFPICKECDESMILEVKDYKINLYGNKHKINNISINEYNQEIVISKIKCNKCNKKQYEIYDNLMYICNECNIILFPLCRNNHTHNMINYFLKNYICNNYNEMYIGYCKKDKINICIKCQKEHIKHDIIYYGEKLPDKNELLNKKKELQIEINKLNNDINEIISKLNNIKDNIKLLYNIYNKIIEKYEDKYRNY